MLTRDKNTLPISESHSEISLEFLNSDAAYRFYQNIGRLNLYSIKRMTTMNACLATGSYPQTP